MIMGISRTFVAAVLLSATTAVAQSGPQSHRLVARDLSLDAPPSSSALAAIWQDRLAAEREKLAALAKTSPGFSSGASTIVVPVFEASFKAGDKTLIVSALFTTPECRDFSGAAAPSLNNCPMRVAVLRNGKTRVVASEADFPFVAALRETPDNKPSEYDNESQRDKTMVVFNPATDEITTVITLNGALDTEKASAIRVAF
jgi:hypothetical protein